MACDFFNSLSSTSRRLLCSCWVFVCALVLASCSSGEGDLTLKCLGSKHEIHGLSDVPGSTTTRARDSHRTFGFTGKKFKGEFVCQQWTESQIRCESSMPDGSFYQLLKVDRAKHEVQHQVYKNEHGVVEETVFDGTCEITHP